jgi:hypothetical protein
MKLLLRASIAALTQRVFAVPASINQQNITARGLTQDFKIANLAGLPYESDERKYCKIEQPPKCTFASRVYDKGNLAEWFLFDHWCKIVGHWGNNLTPTDGSPFFTPLKHPIWPEQMGIHLPPTIKYKDVTYVYTGCLLAGPRSEPFTSNWPGVRLACWIEFDCPWEG